MRQPGAQVAANQPENGVALTNAQGEVIDTSNGNQSKKKTRFSDRAKMPKAKRRELANRNKRQKFTPPPQNDAAGGGGPAAAVGAGPERRHEEGGEEGEGGEGEGGEERSQAAVVG